MKKTSLAGIYAPVLTPFKSDLSTDPPAHARFCKWLVSQGCGLAIFGTNSEANSLSLGERVDLLDYLIGNGVPPVRMMPGTGACALTDAVRLCRLAADAGTAAVLMLPPFYYKDVTEDGLFAFYAETIERVGNGRLKICLYHIPQVSGIPISLHLIERLVSNFPGAVVGIKDSGGDMRNTLALIKAFPDIHVFCGSERFLVETIKEGGAGCISAAANLNPSAIVSAFAESSVGSPGDWQSELNAFRAAFEGLPMIAALKHVAAEFSGHSEFVHVRPPHERLADRIAQQLKERLDSLKFETPGLAEAFSGL